MAEETTVWRVTWDLEVFSHTTAIPALDAPDVNSFRMAFATKEEAFFFKVEMQRFLGDILLGLSDKVRFMNKQTLFHSKDT